MRKYFCKLLNRNIWELGYFGGGATNFKDFESITKTFVEETNVPIESVFISEIFKSRRFKHCKYVYSLAPNQKPCDSAEIIDDVHKWLED